MDKRSCSVASGKMRDAGEVIATVIILVIGIFFAIGGYESLPDGCKFFHQGIEACQLTGSDVDLSLMELVWGLAADYFGSVYFVFLFRRDHSIHSLRT